MSILDSVEKPKSKLETKEVDTVEELQTAVDNKLHNITKEDVVNKIIKNAESRGRVFDTIEQAKQYAEDQLDKQFTKYRIKNGLPICCELCGHGGGTLMKTTEGKYKHQGECPNDHR